jgi:hypothetical protein
MRNPLGSTIGYEGETLTLYNPEGEPIASGTVSVVPPNYSTELTFSQM